MRQPNAATEWGNRMGQPIAATERVNRTGQRNWETEKVPECGNQMRQPNAVTESSNPRFYTISDVRGSQQAKRITATELERRSRYKNSTRSRVPIPGNTKYGTACCRKLSSLKRTVMKQAEIGRLKAPTVQQRRRTTSRSNVSSDNRSSSNRWVRTGDRSQ